MKQDYKPCNRKKCPYYDYKICPHRNAKKTGCLSFTRDKSLERKKSIWETNKDL